MDRGELQKSGGELVVSTSGALDRNPAAVYVAGLGSPASRRTMMGALNKLAELLGISGHRNERGENVTALYVNWPALRFQHVQALKAKLAEGYATATVNRHLSAIRGVLKAAWRLGLIPEEDYRRAIDVGGLSGSTLPAGRDVSEGEIAALFAECSQDLGPAGPRDAAILGLLRFGLRRGEAVALDVEDWDPETRTVRVQGKGRKERLVPVNHGSEEALADWLDVRGTEPGPLFWPIRKGGKLEPRRLTTQAIYHILGTRAKDAGVKDVSPHDLRRTLVGDLLDAGADVVTVSKLLGHANIQTTARYDRRPEEAKRKAAGLIHVPYRRRLTSRS